MTGIDIGLAEGMNNYANLAIAEDGIEIGQLAVNLGAAVGVA